MLRGLVTTVLVSLALVLSVSGAALAQEPSATVGAQPTPVLIDPLDPRAGEGASQVGAPLLALIVVIFVGVAAAGLTYLYVRVVRSR